MLLLGEQEKQKGGRGRREKKERCFAVDFSHTHTHTTLSHILKCFFLVSCPAHGLKCYTDVEGTQITTCKETEGYRTCFTKYNDSKQKRKTIHCQITFLKSIVHALTLSTKLFSVLQPDTSFFLRKKIVSNAT